MRKRGEHNLPLSAIEDIKKRVQSGENQRLIAKDHGVTRSYVSMVGSGRRVHNPLHTVYLKSGGVIYMRCNINMFGISDEDYLFVRQIVEMVKDYEGRNPTK